METGKIRNLSDEELKQQERQSAEQLFRLRFQMKLGQNEGVKKLRDLRKSIARMKTIERERELGLHQEASRQESESAAEPVRPAAKKKSKAAKKGSAKR